MPLNYFSCTCPPHATAKKALAEGSPCTPAARRETQRLRGKETTQAEAEALKLQAGLEALIWF